MKGNNGGPSELNRNAADRGPSDDIFSAEPDHRGNCDGRKNFDHGIVNRVGQDRVFERVHVAAINFREAVVGFALAVKELQHDHSSDMLLQVTIDAAYGGKNPPIRCTNFTPKTLGGAPKHCEK